MTRGELARRTLSMLKDFNHQKTTEYYISTLLDYYYQKKVILGRNEFTVLHMYSNGLVSVKNETYGAQILALNILGDI